MQGNSLIEEFYGITLDINKKTVQGELFDDRARVVQFLGAPERLLLDGWDDRLRPVQYLLTSAEFLVHVAVPGAVAKPGVTSGGGDAPSWDVEGGGAYVDSRQISYPPRRAV